ncbi:hypothetical protein MHL31_00325 [Lutibacter sp. A80]|uniref:hypothetical protein n=1 Tax=Lutibacter sp. A80 TaxID=2918453 RepID=UPI001F0618EE|nr:hypothetical protein [Lutibacter sp. A80]UMB60673.1 hypothetical protein MHL31_00325 [Lutibacter sp. A80]
MKKLLIVICLINTLSCTKNNNETTSISKGIVGTIKYGKGDCMPIIDEASRTYTNFNGTLYFILKSDLENLGDGDFEQLKLNSLNTIIKNGKLNFELPNGTYLIMPEDIYQYSDENTINIENGVIIKKDLFFWKCTSY